MVMVSDDAIIFALYHGRLLPLCERNMVNYSPCGQVAWWINSRWLPHFRLMISPYPRRHRIAFVCDVNLIHTLSDVTSSVTSSQHHFCNISDVINSKMMPSSYLFIAPLC
jgi:hypothetical protein